MNRTKRLILTAMVSSALVYSGCKTPALTASPEIQPLPAGFAERGTDSTQNSGLQPWRSFFKDPYLIQLIDTALQHNQELAIALQEIAMAKNEIRIRHSNLLPRAEAGAGLGIEKVGRYTSQGAGDASTDITPDREVPEWLPDYRLGIVASWEADIWKKLRQSKQAAVKRYLATIEGRNFMVTSLIAEIANGYYELLAFDNQLRIIQQSIALQQRALDVVRIQKQAAAATELAVKKFEAEVLNAQTMAFDIQQKVKAKEYELNFLTGRFPQPIPRDTNDLLNQQPELLSVGLPAQLLQNRPDIQQAELEVAAAKLDVKIARAEFFPSLNITAGLGFQAFNPGYLVKFPESLLASLVGDLAGPLINKQAIKAEYQNANARQIQTLFNYERSILNAYIEVSTELSNWKNYEQLYQYKAKAVDTLVASVQIANDLLRSARADYLEVLLTQRDALDARLELIETKLKQFQTTANLYRALGGGWK